MRSIIALVGLVVFGAASAVPTLAQEGWGVTIPYERFVLDNGLTLIVHEDHKAPIVAVNVWYHVGSKNEKEGRTGFAHLFEHLMFNGSENYNNDYFAVLQPAGATTLNGTTNFDRTNYFQNVPTSALDVALWMESDRMGHLLGAIDQERLDEQRGVVQNEKRQGENQPYGRAFNTIFESVFPEGHPYSWSVIGSMEDLDAASLDDVHEWFENYYGAQNAVIVVAGDVETQDVVERVERFFGDIEPGPPVVRPEIRIPRITGEQRTVMQDRVPRSRVYKVWVMPQWGTADADYLNLASRVLSSGKSSRLYRRLVYDDQLATDINAFTFAMEIAGVFIVQSTARPGVDIAEVERAIDEEMARFLAEGPTNEELQRAKTELQAGFIRGVEGVGGFGGKSDILAQNEVYGGSPDFYLTSQTRLRDATARQVHDAATRWLSDGVFVLQVVPFPDLAASAEGIDRSGGPPSPGTPPDAEFPDVERATLSNGLEVVFARRTAVPVVRLQLSVDAGYSADQFGLPGTAQLAGDMMDEGTDSRTSLEISDELQTLGATLNTGANLDASMVTMSALAENLDESLDLFADVILNPSFPEQDFERLKRNQIAGIQSEKAQPIAMALRVLPRFLYGENHAYGTPFTGSGFEETVEQITRGDLEEFHETWFKPNNATVVVVGATTLDEIVPMLEERFRNWERGEVPHKNLAEVEAPRQSALYLLDRPGAIQSVILAGYLAPPTNNPDEIEIELMNDVLGGGFNARINMNLREDKGWSYGAGSFMPNAEGQRPFFAYAPVQTDKTQQSVQELVGELNGILGERPPTADELQRVINENTLSLAGQWESGGAVLGTMSQMVRYGLPDDYYDGYASRVRAAQLDDISEAAEFITPDATVWVVVGDRAVIEPGLRELNVGPVIPIDADGNVLEDMMP